MPTLAPFYSASTLELPSVPALQSSQVNVSFAGTGSGYDAANSSARRGYVYFPQTDTRREIDTWARTEVLRKARYLTRNVGFAKRCTRGLAHMVGSLSPRPLTKDKTWNTKALALFDRRAGSPLTFDRAAQFDVYSCQPMITGTRLQDGDLGTVLTENITGGAMCAFFEGHQIANGNGSIAAGWDDGVRIANERAALFRLLDPADKNRAVDIPASDFILHVDRLSFGHRRGISALHHAINNMLDRTEIWSDVKMGIKLSNRIGYYIARQQIAPSGAPKGMGNRVTTGSDDDGNPVLIENVYRGGKMLQLNAGEEIKQLLDQRPHPNSREFLEDLNRDIAWGIGLSPDVLWNIAKLGGASVRYVLADAMIWIQAQQQLLVDQFLTRFWIYFVAKEMRAGRLEKCADPEWWKVGFLPPARLTVDIGRDGKLSIDLHRAGMLTLQRWYGEQGLEWEAELEQHVREYATKLQICQKIGEEFGIEIDPAKVFPPPPGSSPSSLVDPAGNPVSSDPAFGQEDTVQKINDVHEWMLAQQKAA